MPGRDNLLSLILILLIIFFGCSKKPEEWGGFYRSDGRWLKDSAGRVLILRGMNVTGANKWPDPDTGKFFPSWLSPEDFRRIASWGYNSVRFLIIWEAIEPERGKFDDEYLSDVYTITEWARDAGLLTVLDMHQDIYSRKFYGDGAPEWAVLDDGIPFTPRTPWYNNYLEPAVQRAYDSFWQNREGIQDEYFSAWRMVVEKFADADWIVGYDIMNEPFPGTTFNPDEFDEKYLQPFYDKAISSITEIDSKHIIFIEPNAMRTNVLAGVGLPSALEFDKNTLRNLAYAPHFYDPATTANYRYDNNKRRLKDAIQAIYDDAERMGIPVWVGEWGVWEGDIGNGDRFLEDQLSVLDEFIAPWSFWNYNRTGNMTPLKETWFLDYLIRPQPSKVAGTPEALSFDQRAKVFTFSYIEERLSLPTEVIVPAQFSEYRVLIEPERDFEWVVKEDGLKILLIYPEKGGDRVSITIKP